MQIKLGETKGVTIVTIEGEINLESSPQLRKAFDDLLKKGTQKIMLDFQKISYIDSSGLATCVELFQRLQDKSGKLCLVQLPVKVRNVFEVTRLDKLFPIYNSQEEAFVNF
ncbi:MAG: STAS domain-containing protein [Candidatus Omnitrophota bacterium]|jgi:anti-sigma B factor antagonist|nr:STAS domain-containing protein [Candidatus Omnitrophota bacterium]